MRGCTRHRLVLVAAPAGIKFGHFTLGKRLARGGMAEVFLARQRGPEGFDRRVAVKRILPHLAETPDFVRMFLDEARLAARLSHPNVVHIYELGQVDGDYFIAMEFVDGIHAGQLVDLARTDPLPPVLVARLGADAAGALAYAHRLEDVDGRPLQLVHRDVTPHNLMISYDGVVKLVDFGIAKAALKADETRPGIVKGKYAYMSPEQTVGRALDGRSDVFSLGVCLWELQAGTTIVDRGDVVEAMKVIRDGRYLPIERVAPRTPPALAHAIGWALAHQRDDRPTAAQLQVALEEYIKRAPQVATSGQLAEWIRPRFPRALAGPADDVGPRSARRTGAPGPRDGTANLGPVSGRPGTVPVVVTDVPAAIRGAGTAVVAVTEGVAPLSDAAVRPITSERAARGEASRSQPPPLPAAARPRAPTHLDDDPDHHEEPTDAPTRRHLPSDLARLPPAAPRPVPTARIQPVPTARSAAVPDLRSHRIPLLIAGGLALAVGIGLAVVIAGGSAGHRAPARDAALAITPRLDAAPEVMALSGEPVDAAVDAPSAVVDATAAPASSATLEIITRPAGATVQLGADHHATPATLALPSGRVTFTVAKDGYAPIERSVTLAAGEHRSVELELELERRSGGRRSSAPSIASVGYLTVRTTPYSVVTVGGRALGETPFAGVALPTGTHVLTFTNPDRHAVKRTVTIRTGKTVKLSFTLP